MAKISGYEQDVQKLRHQLMGSIAQGDASEMHNALIALCDIVGTQGGRIMALESQLAETASARNRREMLAVEERIAALEKNLDE